MRMKQLAMGFLANQMMIPAWGADVMSFPEVWRTISENSKAQQAAGLETDAAAVAENRSEKHWLPRVYLQARTFGTDDPAQSFMGILEQRTLQASDFDPDSLNHPEKRVYTQGTLGLDWPLYEGGAKVSQVKLQRHLRTAAEKEAASVQLKQYSVVSKAYGSIAVLQEQKKKLVQISDVIERLMKKYQLGVRSNPVGYSGLLGLKSLKNRLQGLIQAIDAQTESHLFALQEMGLQKTPWVPKENDPVAFVGAYLKAQGEKPSPTFESLQEKTQAAQAAAEMEKARNRPRVGAFAETGLFKGSQGTAQNNTAGLYLQWNLWSPSDSGSYQEARLKSQAAEKAAEAFAQVERSERLALASSLQALKENILLLKESDKFLLEQTKVTENLFRNGSVNALQFVEVLSRRADLVETQSQASLQLLQVASQHILKSNFELPQDLSQGDRK